MNRRQLLKSFGLLLTPGAVWLPQSLSASTQGTVIVTDPFYLKHLMPAGHPESPERLQAVLEHLEKAGHSTQQEPFPWNDKIIDWLQLVHYVSHIESLKTNHPLSEQVARKLVSDVISATEAVVHGKYQNAFCACRPPGHHAENTGKIEGFCLYNSVAVAARHAQQSLGLEKILIVDWDYHHGNGTESAFYDDDTVLFFSTHDQYAYPGTGSPDKRGTGRGEGYNVNVHLPCGTTDRQIIKVFQEQLVPLAQSFKPDLILVSAGFDSRMNDLLGCYAITDSGFVQLTDIVMQLADELCDGRVVSVMEGGYNIEGNASAVVAHVEQLMSATG